MSTAAPATPVPVHRGLTRVGEASLSVLAAGPDDGEVVVALHGIPSGAELWRDVLGRLGAAGYRALAPDLPGYGSTVVPPSADHSLAGAAEMVADWIRHDLDGGPVWLLGHDLGGGVAQILLARHPGLIARLTLGDTVVEDSWPVRPISMLRGLAVARLYDTLGAVGLGVNPYTRWELRNAFAEPDRLDLDTETRVFWDGKITDGAGRRAFTRHLQALDPTQTVEAAPGVRAADVPAQLIWGAQDSYQSYEEVGVRLAELLGADDVTIIEDGGHFLPLECPDAYVDAMLAWRRRGAQGTGPDAA